MFTNVQLWLGVISLARELIKYLRERDDREVAAAKVAVAKDALKKRDNSKIKEALNDIFE